MQALIGVTALVGAFLMPSATFMAATEIHEPVAVVETVQTVEPLERVEYASVEKMQRVEPPAPPEPPSYPIDCEQFRPLVAKYFPASQVNNALFVMSKESGCDVYAVSHTNDYGLFQLNNNPTYEPESNIRIAAGLYYGGRIGENNWSAWYAVCTPGSYPQPKYPGIHCQ